MTVAGVGGPCETTRHEYGAGPFAGHPAGAQLALVQQTVDSVGDFVSTEVCWRCLTRRTLVVSRDTGRVLNRRYARPERPVARIAVLVVPPTEAAEFVPVDAMAGIKERIGHRELVLMTLPRWGSVAVVPGRSAGAARVNLWASVLARELGAAGGSALAGTVVFAGWASGAVLVDLPAPVLAVWSHLRASE